MINIGCSTTIRETSFIAPVNENNLSIVEVRQLKVYAEGIDGSFLHWIQWDATGYFCSSIESNPKFKKSQGVARGLRDTINGSRQLTMKWMIF